MLLAGFCTAKGELVCAILYPKPLDFKFYQDSVKFILFLAFMASLGMIYSLVMYVRNGVSLSCHVCHEQSKSLRHVHQEQCKTVPVSCTLGTVYVSVSCTSGAVYVSVSCTSGLV